MTMTHDMQGLSENQSRNLPLTMTGPALIGGAASASPAPRGAMCL